jgi:hypothetical protein
MADEPQFKLPEYTPEEAARAHIAIQLRICVSLVHIERERLERIIYGRELIWLHFTDWYGNFDLPLLLKEKLIEPDERFAYLPSGGWQDHFPPSPYRITARGTSVLEHTGLYIWKGETR